MRDAEAMLKQGAAILDPLLAAHGFVFQFLGSGASSGGDFAYGEFRRDDRTLEIHFRDSIGLVQYRIGDRSIDHQKYMHSFLKKRNASHYPGFSNDPLDGFRHLCMDLKEYGSEFLTGTDACFCRRIDLAEELPPERPGPPD